MPSLRQFALALLAVTAALAVGTVPVATRAPPQAVCDVCTGALEDAAAERGASLERESSSVTVRVAANGSARWNARVTIAEGAEALENASLRGAIVADALGRARSIVDDPRDVRSRVENRSLVVSYRDPGAAERIAGVLVFTRLHADGPSMPLAMGGDGPRYLEADELVVRAPDRYAARGDYADATENETAVRWIGGDGSRTSLDGSTKVTFVPEGTMFTGVRTAIARILVGL